VLLSERDWLEGLEAVAGGGGRPEARPVLAWIAGRSLDLDEAEVKGAVRRAMLLLATGGDPQRELDLEGRAVTALAAELDRPERRDALAGALAELRAHAEGLSHVNVLLDELLLDADLAWRALAAGLIGDELSEDD
jgi:hypothetical protein